MVVVSDAQTSNTGIKSKSGSLYSLHLALIILQLNQTIRLPENQNFINGPWTKFKEGRSCFHQFEDDMSHLVMINILSQCFYLNINLNPDHQRVLRWSVRPIREQHFDILDKWRCCSEVLVLHSLVCLKVGI